MALFVPLDVDFPSDPKFLKAGPIAGYLYFSSLALIKRTKSDGFVALEQLASLCVGFPGKPAAHAERLVDAGLWVPVDGGWNAPAYVKRNPTRAEVEAKSEAKRAASVLANHTRWHSDKRRSEDCPHCIREASDLGEPSDPVASPSTPTPTETPTEPVAAESDVDQETARRIADRRRRGHDIGPGLARLIREDVERDLALAPNVTAVEPRSEVDRLIAMRGELLCQADLVEGESRDALIADAVALEAEIESLRRTA